MGLGKVGKEERFWGWAMTSVVTTTPCFAPIVWLLACLLVGWAWFWSRGYLFECVSSPVLCYLREMGLGLSMAYPN
ncbi:uncharacterized protein B0H64DRAFT_403948 [Chaetomium fimeti]|uniref:Uncharacterized protein n=1 Tax=Chaetomium fimeti TaxID=1854472 RepID=A0AAE0HBB6_9PEZI|nr:hypothetical protein B0H64DRAFT_403948 [Chaetomium fimeti]